MDPKFKNFNPLFAWLLDLQSCRHSVKKIYIWHLFTWCGQARLTSHTINFKNCYISYTYCAISTFLVFDSFRSFAWSSSPPPKICRSTSLLLVWSYVNSFPSLDHLIQLVMMAVRILLDFHNYYSHYYKIVLISFFLFLFNFSKLENREFHSYYSHYCKIVFLYLFSFF